MGDLVPEHRKLPVGAHRERTVQNADRAPAAAIPNRLDHTKAAPRRASFSPQSGGRGRCSGLLRQLLLKSEDRDLKNYLLTTVQLYHPATSSLYESTHLFTGHSLYEVGWPPPYPCSLVILSLAFPKTSHAFFFCRKNLDPLGNRVLHKTWFEA